MLKDGSAKPHQVPRAAVKSLSGAIVAANLLSVASPALALPQGADVAAGSVALIHSAERLDVQQHSQKAIINWQGFDIGATEHVNFHQPSSHSVILNRVTGGNPSAILGKMSANGKVFLVNPNGVTFAPGAQVDVNALVASTLDITDSDFLNEHFQFQRSGGNAAVINRGQINANTIALLGNQVINDGWLRASSSTDTAASIALVAGDKVTLSFGVDGLLAVDIQQGTYDALVENRQLIRADGGSVLLRAEAADALIGAAVNNSGIIQAQGIAEREGKIVLLADMSSGTTSVSGTLDVSSNTGDGGFIETSAATVTVAENTLVNSASLTGDSGLWLIDPKDVTIDNSGAVGTLAASSLQNTLDNFGSVTVQTTSHVSAVPGNGDIKVNADISWSRDAAVLTLQAERNIEINAKINASGAGSGVALDTGLSYNSGNNWNTSYSAAQFAQDKHLLFGDAGSITLSGADAVYRRDGQTSQVINGNNTALAGNTAFDELSQLNPSIHAVLGVDIDASAGLDSIGLTGTHSGNTLLGFDGLGNTISNLNINDSGAANVGLFSEAGSDSYLRNLTLNGGTVIGRSHVGAAVGYADGLTLDNVSSNVAIRVSSSAFNTGGLVGYMNNSHISNSSVVADIIGNFRVGGLVGNMDRSQISDSSASGRIRGDNLIGGIAARAAIDSSLKNVHFNGDVETNTGKARELGGIVGKLYNSQLENAYSSGTVSGTADKGGNYGGDLGGLVGYAISDDASYQTYIRNAYSLSDISLNAAGDDNLNTARAVGGIVGRTQGTSASKVAIDNVYALGDVSVRANEGADYFAAGGIAGIAKHVNISNTFYMGQVSDTNGDSTTTATNLRGAIVGNLISDATLANSYWDSSKHSSATGLGSGSVSQVAGLDSTAQKQKTSYLGFDFGACGASNNWCIVEGLTLPGINSVRHSESVTDSTVLNTSKTYDANVFSAAASVTLTSDQQRLVANAGSALIESNSKNADHYGNGDFTLTGYASAQLILEVATPNFSVQITPKNLSYSVTVDSKIYDALDTATNIQGTLAAAFSGDTVTLDTSAASAQFSDANVGTNKSISVTGLSLSGADSANYSISSSATSSANITPAALQATLNDLVRTYDGSAFSGGNGYTLSGFVGTENSSVVSGSLSYGGSAQGASAVGNYTISGSGLSAANYQISYLDAQLQISNPAPRTPDTIAAELSTDLGVDCSSSRAGNCVSQGATLTQSFIDEQKAEIPANTQREITLINGGIKLTN
ncbi:MAG: filamentous hemagglutinin N-terminal domain-containing protein [Pseudomonadales bacterium]